MNRYMLVVRQGDFDPSQYTPENMEEIFKSVEGWIGQLSDKNVLIDTAPLIMDSAKTLRKKGGATSIEGPYAEGAEVMAGYYIIRAESLEKAVELSKECPQLSIGSNVEVIELGRLRHGCID